MSHEKKEILKDISTLRAEIRRIWAEVDQKAISKREALVRLDELSDAEIDGECRGDMMDVLDKASAMVGGRAPVLTEVAEKDRVIPEGVAGGARRAVAEAPASNIIQLPRGL